MALSWLVLLALAWWLYRPDVSRAFDLLDFPDTLELLQANDGLWARIDAYTQIALHQGRFNPGAYAWMAAQWSWFGLEVRWWQLSRFAVMAIIAALAYLLLRRLGMTRAGALAGSGVYVIAPAATRGWSWLTSAEPIGTALVLGATLMVTNSTAATRLARVAACVLIALMVAAVVLTKEMLVAACVLPMLALWATWHQRETPASRRHAWEIVAAGTIGAVIALVPIVKAFLSAPPDAYAARFRLSGVSAIDLLGSFWSAAVPFAPVAGASAQVLGVVIVAYVAIVVTGWALLAHRGIGPTWRLLAIGLGLPLVGTIAYAPWPSYNFGYALPFLFGAAVIVAGAASGLQSVPLGVRIATVAPAAVIIAFGITGVLIEVRPLQSLLATIRPLLPLVHEQAGTDSVIVTANAFQLERPYTSFAYRLSRLAGATGSPWPPSRSGSCEEASKFARTDPTFLVVRVNPECPPMENIIREIEAPYHLFEWRTFRVVEHRTRMDMSRAPRVP